MNRPPRIAPVIDTPEWHRFCDAANEVMRIVWEWLNQCADAFTPDDEDDET